MFNWKDNLFKVAIKGSAQNKLEVKWHPTTIHSTISGSEPNLEGIHYLFQDEEMQSFESDPNNLLANCYNLSASTSPEFHNKPPKSKPSTTCYDVFRLGKYNKGQIVKTGFSFDHTSLCRVPVILTRLEHQEKDVKFLLLGITEIKVKDCEEKRFSIAPLRLFSSPNSCESILNNLQSVRFISDYGIICLDARGDSRTIAFQISFGHHELCPDISVQNFICSDGDIKGSTLSKSDVTMMDVYNSFINKTILAVIRWNDSQSQAKCGAYLFSNLCNTKYQMKKIPLDPLFPSQFEKIADRIAIMSLMTTNSYPCLKSACLVMLTTSRFIVKFVDGIMMHKIRMEESFDNQLKTGALFKDALRLITWPDEKMVERNDLDGGVEVKVKDVLNALAFQGKKCQIDDMEMESSVRSKEVFIERHLKHLSDADNDAGPKVKTKHLLPLVSLTSEHTELGRGHTDNKVVVPPSLCQVKRVWKRMTRNYLVCGVDMIKLSQSGHNFCDIHLILVPINPCQTSTNSKSLLVCKLSSHHLSSSTSMSAEPLSPPTKRTCLANPQSSLHNSSNSEASSSLTVTASLNTQGFWGCEDINVQVYLVYSVEDAQGPDSTRKCYKMNCGRVTVSQREKLEELYSLSSSIKKCHEKKDFLNKEDVTTLDCVQSSLELCISGVFSPVTSLLEKIKSHPSITFLPRFDQYIYSADHQRLQSCRLKWPKQFDSGTAVVKVFAMCWDDLLLFIEFLDFISPSDISLRLHDTADHNPSLKLKSMNGVVDTLLGKVEGAMLRMTKDLNSVAITIPSATDDDVEIIADYPSPKFHSSVQKTDYDKSNKVIDLDKYDNQNPSASKIGIPTSPGSCEKVKEQRTAPSTSQDMDDDLNQFDFGNGFASKAEIEGKMKKGLGVKKGSKSKLTTMKRK